ncbi:M4 family metallopeptidase [Solicola gregarius]|uniref:Neutral metalloproteinase n=1 Tax=Solicola gregarius TaxID=2908642 RepID=A0AA46TLI9_9ACTN|nr:M4 family metallopeptidase [Solicola gregarius]UYM07491.1 M4 family metallopeptidase [Solicola gregarius]
MRKVIAVASSTVLAAGLGAMAPLSGAAAVGNAPDDNPQAVARQFVKENRTDVLGTRGDAYRVVDKVTSKDGAAVRYERTYRGLPVLGGDFVVHVTENGRTDNVSVAQDRAIRVNNAPGVAKSAARTQAREGATSATVRRVGEPRLVVDARDGRPVLAWQTVVHGVQADGQTPSRQSVVTDARTGKVRSADEAIMTPIRVGQKADAGPGQADGSEAAEAGTGSGIFVGDVEIDTTSGASGFEMIDPSHGNGETCDMNNTEFSCDTFVDDDNAWGDGTNADRASAGVDAHFGAATTFDYFKETHGRDGIFGDGTGVPSRVHYGTGYVNAFWDGSQMTYGDGAGDAAPLVELDVAGHEMSHGVNEHTAGLEYSGDAGGLNEATSDIFGTMVEFYANNASDTPDFTIGEMIDINGDGTPLRYMDEPSKDGGSFDCWSEEVPASDPHYSSGVGNHFFYLLANGSGESEFGNSPTCDGSTVTGIGNEAAAAIWFKALSEYMVSTETYADAREHTVQAATDLYGEGSAEVQAVEAAWTAVSVG